MMQVTDAGNVVEPHSDDAGDEESGSCSSMDRKDVFLCTFDWSRMFEVEEKLSKITHAYRKLAQQSGEVDELVKAVVCSCGSDITVSWSSFSIPDIGVTCTLLIDSVQVAVADGKSFKFAEKAAFSKVASILSQPNLEVMREPRLVGSDEPIRKSTPPLFPDDTISALCKFRSNWKHTKRTQQDQVTVLKGDGESFPSNSVIQSETGGNRIRTRAIYQMPSKQSVLQLSKSELIIIRKLDSSLQTSSAEILESSAKLCETKLNFCEEPLLSDHFHCLITVDKQVIGDAVADSQQEARSAAVEAAVANCCTILVKNMKIDTARNVITSQQLLTDDVQLNIIPESNIGCRMLKKMGWTGGGLVPGGAKNPAIVNGRSISTDRTGLGFKKRVPNPHDVLQRLFDDHLRTHQLEDLIFSPDISKEIQTIIQKEAAMRGLHVSYCDSDQQSKQFIFVGLHRSVVKLAEHIRANGGETQRYILIEAKADTDIHLKPQSDGILSNSLSHISLPDCHKFSVIEPMSPVLRGFESEQISVANQEKSLSSVSPMVLNTSVKDSTNLSCISKNSSAKFAEFSTPESLIKSGEITNTGISEKRFTGSNLTSKSDTLKYRKLLNGRVRLSRNTKSFDSNLFVIIKFDSPTVIPPAIMLDISSELCGMKVVHEIIQTNDKKVTCSITLSGKNVGTGVGETESSAKVAAADNALKSLSQVCYTIIVKHLSKSEAPKSVITPDQLIAMEKEHTLNTKSTSGGDESLLTAEILTRRALNRIIADYCNNPQHEEIVFSPEFNSTDRDLVIMEGSKRGLVFSRFGKGGKRSQFFALRRNRTPVELVEFLKVNGGKTIGFVLVEPQSRTRFVPAKLQEPAVINPEQQNVLMRHKVEVAVAAVKKNKSRPPESSCVKKKSLSHFISSSSPPKNSFERRLLSCVTENRKTGLNNRSSFPSSSASGKRVALSTASKLVVPRPGCVKPSNHVVSSGVSPDYSEKLLLQCMRPCRRKIKSLDRFVIVKSLSSGDGRFSSISILNTSAKLCRLEVEYKMFLADNNMFRCSVCLSGKPVGSAVALGWTEYAARRFAANRALTYLSKLYPSIIFNDKLSVNDRLFAFDQLTGQDKAGAPVKARKCNIIKEGLQDMEAMQEAMEDLEAMKDLEAIQDLMSCHAVEPSAESLLQSNRKTPLEIVKFVRANGGKTLQYKLVEPTRRRI